MGIMMRVTGDTIALSPPLVITEEQIGEIVDKLSKVIKAVASGFTVIPGRLTEPRPESITAKGPERSATLPTLHGDVVFMDSGLAFGAPE